MAHIEADAAHVPALQIGHVDLQGTTADWLMARRLEPFVFVILGHNVPTGRFQRCIESLQRQHGTDWGAILIDDYSSESLALKQIRIAATLLGKRASLLRLRTRRGGMANLHTAIASLCGNPDSVIVTLDADDALLGGGVIKTLREAYSRGCQLTIGSMLRTDKFAQYKVDTHNPRAARGGAVWQHLRSFKKYLFERVPLEDLQLGGRYVDLAYDWAFMLPMVELAQNDSDASRCTVVHIKHLLYLYEPSGEGKGDDRARREDIIRQIIEKPSRRLISLNTQASL